MNKKLISYFSAIRIIVAVGGLILIGFILQKFNSKTIDPFQAGKERLDEKLTAKEVKTSIHKGSILLFKQEQRGEIWIFDEHNTPLLIDKFFFKYPNLRSGPPIHLNDTRLPEGIYNLERIQADSIPSLCLDFPNLFDRRKQIADQRAFPNSEYCLSDSDIIVPQSILFELIALSEKLTKEGVEVLIFPTDFRVNQPDCNRCPTWINELYASLNLHLKKFPIQE